MKTHVTNRAAARLMHRGALALSRIEHNGIRVDVPYLDNQIAKVGAQIKDLTTQLRRDKIYGEWRKAYGEKASMGSREQLAAVVFDRLKMPRSDVEAREKKKFGEDGQIEGRKSKYDEATFAHLDVDFIRDYFRMQKLAKLKGTYLEGIRREVVDGFVHPSYNLHTVATFRSSCSQPNFQNILARNKKLAELLRRCYIPRKRRHLVEHDWAQIEVRVAAGYNKDPRLMAYIKDTSTDMHRDMAAELFLMDIEWLVANKDWAKKTVRDYAKNRFVFPTFYGQVYFQCAQDLWKPVAAGELMPDGKTTIRKHLKSKGINSLGDCTPGAETKKGTFVHHVKEVEAHLWKTFSVYAQWKKDWWNAYLKEGGFRLYTGFWIEGIFKRNDVGNYPIQGSAFHCELLTLIMMQEEIDRRKMKSLLVGEIHDCDNSDVVPDELQEYLGLLYEIKTKRVPKAFPWINVPMEAEAEVCEIDAPWNTKRQWVTDDKGIWGRKHDPERQAGEQTTGEVRQDGPQGATADHRLDGCRPRNRHRGAARDRREGRRCEQETCQEGA